MAVSLIAISELGPNSLLKLDEEYRGGCLSYVRYRTEYLCPEEDNFSSGERVKCRRDPDEGMTRPRSMRNATFGRDSMGIIPTTRTPVTDEVIDAIADIEMQRRETEKAAGFAMSCSSALHRLNELLHHETEALRLRGPDAANAENVEAVRREIGRVKALAVSSGKNRFPGAGRARQGQVTGQNASWQGAPRNPPRNKGRRTMGRAGGRG